MPKTYMALDVPQGELEWFKLRIGKVTASELDNLLSPEFKERTGETPRTYLCKKVAEQWQGHALPGFTSWATEQGDIKEDEAIPWYALNFDHEVKRVGFVETDDKLAGCSPDALLGDDGGLEVKCPEAHTHVKYLIDGVLPKEYVTQVHMCLYVTQRPWWVFLSYRRRFPPLIIRVQRDEEICVKIDTAVKKFNAALNEAMRKLESEGVQ